MVMQCTIAYIQSDKKYVVEHTSAILVAILDFFQSALMVIESPWPPSYMLIIHSIPLQAIFKDIYGAFESASSEIVLYHRFIELLLAAPPEFRVHDSDIRLGGALSNSTLWSSLSKFEI